MFNKSIYTGRRQTLAALMKENGVALFIGNKLSPMDYKANAYPFHQDDSFRYFFGLNEPDLAAIIDFESGSEILFGQDYSIDDRIWSNNLKDKEELAHLSGIEKTGRIEDLLTCINREKDKGRQIHHVHYDRAENRLALIELTGSYQPSHKLMENIIAMRSVKSSEEIEEIEEAITDAGKIFAVAKEMAVGGLRELDIVSRMVYETIKIGSKTSFRPIVTIRGETLHNETYDNILSAGDMLLVDFGIFSKEGYSSDNTRTYPVGRNFTLQQQEIYSIVLNAQEKAISTVRPGIKNLETHRAACLAITEGLKNLGIMKGDIHAAVEEGAHALFFPHGIGHMLGINTHDMEAFGEDRVGYEKEQNRSGKFGLKSLRLARELKKGFVLTIEPGIYFIPGLIDKWYSEGKYKEFINYDKLPIYRNFGGIRIEDDILVTDSSSRILGASISK